MPAKKGSSSKSKAAAEDTGYPQYILDSMIEKDGGIKYLIKWKGYGNAWNSWEPPAHLDNFVQEIREWHEEYPDKPRPRGFKSKAGKARAGPSPKSTPSPKAVPKPAPAKSNTVANSSPKTRRQQAKKTVAKPAVVEPIPEAIVGSKKVGDEILYLIEWQGAATKTTWEPAEKLSEYADSIQEWHEEHPEYETPEGFVSTRPVVQVDYDSDSELSELESEPEEPETEPIVEPIIEDIVEPVVEDIVEPVAEPVVEPVSEPVAEPVVEPTPGPAASSSKPKPKPTRKSPQKSRASPPSKKDKVGTKVDQTGFTKLNVDEPEEEEEGCLDIPEEIRDCKKTRKGDMLYRIKWRGSTKLTWEPPKNLFNHRSEIQEWHESHPDKPRPAGFKSRFPEPSQSQDHDVDMMDVDDDMDMDMDAQADEDNRPVGPGWLDASNKYYVSIRTHLAGDAETSRHLDILVTAMRNVVSTTLAQETLAQIADGLPLAHVEKDRHFGPSYWRHPLLDQHTVLCPGVMDRLQTFLRQYDFSALALDLDSLDNYLHTDPDLTPELFTVRLVEMVALGIHRLAILVNDLLYHPVQNPWHDYLESWTPCVEAMEEGKHVEELGTQDRLWCAPVTFFYHRWYNNTMHYRDGYRDQIGYWAENRILGGVLLLDRSKGLWDPTNTDLYLHPDRADVPEEIFKLSAFQKRKLVELCMVGEAGQAPTLDGPWTLPVLPHTGRPDHRGRVSEAVTTPYVHLVHSMIFRDAFERNWQTVPYQQQPFNCY